MLLLTLSEMLSHADSRYDYRLITASNGEEALQQMYQELPDLVLSDIMMPLVDGYAFLETVRQHPEWLHIPILFVTAKNSPQDKHEGLTKGVEEYVTKPYRASELVTLIDKQLDRYFAAQNDVQADFETLKRNILRMLPANFALPLNDVTAYSEQLATSMADIQTEDALKEALFGIQQSSAGLTMLIEDFIALAELRTGETENAFSQRAAPIYDAGLIPFEACHRCSESARALGAEVSVPEIRNLPPIYGDMGLLLPVIERLAQLSLSYYPHGEQRQVGIDTSYSAEVVRFHLSFGFGVSAEDSAIIQTILQSDSLDQTRLSEFAPSLTIANAYIQLHKGRICFNDRSPAEFEFTSELPRAAPP